MKLSPGKRLLKAMKEERPLQMIGVINPYVALMAQEIGFRALYLSGAGVANSSYALPDLGITTFKEIFEDAFRIVTAVDLPLVVDIDTGWGNPLMIKRVVKSMVRIGVAGIHIEDQDTQEKRCGHLPGKILVSLEEMVDRIAAAVDAKTDPDFVIIARTDAYANEGLEKAIERALAYQRAGADVIFPEALSSLEEYRLFKKAIGCSILANLTEFGKTPLFNLNELALAEVDIALYPLTINRLMNLAAQKGLQEIRLQGSQASLIPFMQTREELYRILETRSKREV